MCTYNELNCQEVGTTLLLGLMLTGGHRRHDIIATAKLAPLSRECRGVLTGHPPRHTWVRRSWMLVVLLCVYVCVCKWSRCEEQPRVYRGLTMETEAW